MIALAFAAGAVAVLAARWAVRLMPDAVVVDVANGNVIVIRKERRRG